MMTAESLADARMMGITHAAFRRDLAPGPADAHGYAGAAGGRWRTGCCG
jgi:hypothetical protein